MRIVLPRKSSRCFFHSVRRKRKRRLTSEFDSTAAQIARRMIERTRRAIALCTTAESTLCVLAVSTLVTATERLCLPSAFHSAFCCIDWLFCGTARIVRHDSLLSHFFVLPLSTCLLRVVTGLDLIESNRFLNYVTLICAPPKIEQLWLTTLLAVYWCFHTAHPCHSKAVLLN